jgi:hypothetical protein
MTQLIGESETTLVYMTIHTVLFSVTYMMVLTGSYEYQ